MNVTRRTFVQTSGTIAMGMTWGQRNAKAAASERVRVGVMGAGGRALSLINSFARNPAVEIVAISDIDAGRLPKGLQTAETLQGKAPRAEKDFRKMIDDKSIDAMVIGAPDHWHAIPTILACQAEKDVYVEKPDSHNIVEGMTMVAAMRKHQRIVQMGSQHRSNQRLQSAVEFVRQGNLGRCLVAKAWESTRQGAVKAVPDSPVPSGVDYDMWQGPVAERPFNANRFHGRWRWFYDYGTGDLGNDGVHRLDMAVALMDAASAAQGEPPLGLPRTIYANGGKWYFDDAQEFPDTLQANFEFGADERKKLLTYEMRLWAPYNYLGQSEGAAVFGDKGSLVIGNTSWIAYGNRGEKIGEGSGDSSEVPHVQNFIDCVRSRAKPVCDLETVGHPASVLCHAGNIAARVGRLLTLDPENETFVGDDEANQLRGRQAYRKPWVLPSV
ncbi:MAG: Gfo/Idh/MocA family oxidoreductase [Pirellulaceae bacterium]